MSDQRPNPDELLAQVQRQEARKNRGKLKVFFGASAGVGKTYAMLEEARARAAEGMDVVVGYAEPHARPETEAMLLGMELLPYRFIEYKGSKLKEFDLDAALLRKPGLVLVDELAHTNAPGLRHEKRWQDVMELLNAGINVYTTLNVQHLESVNDVVERITGVKVRETLPDSVLEQADEVELVDIAPEELLERFSEGKIYRPEQAERASRHFFTKGNLIALREMALRRTAEKVDTAMQDFRRTNAVKSTWATSERILVCVGPSPLSARLVRATRRLAAGIKAPWVAVYVETPATVRMSESERQRVDRHLRLAERLGASAVTLAGDNVADEVIAYANSHNMTRIVLGKPSRPRWREWLSGSFVDRIIRNSGEIDIHLIRGEREEAETPQPSLPHARAWDVRGYAWAAGLCALVTFIGWYLCNRQGMANTNVLMMYLLVVLWIARHFSRGAAVLASILGVAAFDFCLVNPYFTFAVSDQQYIITFAVMLVTALTISTLTHRVRAQAESARQREARTAALLELSCELAAARTVVEIAGSTQRQIAAATGASAAVLMMDKDRQLAAIRDVATLRQLDPNEMAVAQWVFGHDQPAGRGTATLPSSQGAYLPLCGTRGTVGVLGVFAPDNGLWSTQHQQLVVAFASQAAMALERAALVEETHQAWETAESEILRNTLLSGVSHDLHTPLAAITGAASTLIEHGEALSIAERDEMLQTIYTESEHMERLINNLLDMTRLESGGLVLNKEWHSLQEIVESVLRHLHRRLGSREVRAALPDDLPLIEMDGVAIRQVLINLVENAIEHAPSSTPIEITASFDSRAVTVEVADRGPGIPPGTEQRIFEKFFRDNSTAGRRGIGLGLAICRGIVEAHGGTITATNRPGGGAAVRFTLPTVKSAPKVEG